MGVGIAIGVLVGLDADFKVPPADQRRNAHAVVVDQLQLAPLGDHHVGVLQVAVGDPGVGQLLDQVDPAARRLAQGLFVAGERPGAAPFEKRVALNPIHQDQGIPFAVAGGADALVAILEIDQAAQLAALQIGADLVIPLAPLGRFGCKNTDGERALVAGGDCLVDDRERTRPGPRLVALVLGDEALAERGIAKRQSRILQHRAEVRGQRPGHRSPLIGARGSRSFAEARAMAQAVRTVKWCASSGRSRRARRGPPE